MNGMGTGEWYEPSGLTPEELAALPPYDEIAGKEFTKIAAISGEEVAINVIIATDPDCWVPTEEEFARARPAIEVDPDLVKAAWSANRRGIGVSQSQRRRSQGSGTHRNRSRLRRSKLADLPSEKAIQRMRLFIDRYCEKSGTSTHPGEGVTEAVVLGLAQNVDEIGRPLCPCRFYPDKKEEIKYRTWVCACDDMQIYKYCHCLLFVNAEGLPITEYLPEDHEGRAIYGLVKDPTPDKGRPLRHKAEEREQERRERPS